mmetsp:Transcript_44829/g.80592  ORF Transcript_44829/g.80592 Transcript_44829/m.80592 type:complete len:219 (-) Transcript_44829:1602-2258(-)
MQSAGHVAVLHFSLWRNFSVHFPWSSFSATTTLCRSFKPPPQSLLHLDQSVHFDSTQSVGQGSLMHWNDSLRGGQTMPPCEEFVRMGRCRIAAPTPQVTLHSSSVQFPTTQSSGQGCSLQFRTWRRFFGHSAPPYLGGARTMRERSWLPPPQLRLQAVEPLQLSMRQSRGHGGPLHFLCCMCSLGHAAPPFLGDVLMRTRTVTPSPHDVLHVDHSPQA